jgi:hypothetical protein
VAAWETWNSLARVSVDDENEESYVVQKAVKSACQAEYEAVRRVCHLPSGFDSMTPSDI